MQTKPSVIPPDAALPSIAKSKADETMLGHFLDWLGKLAVNLVVAGLILVLTFWLAGWAARFMRRTLARVHRNAPDPTLESFSASLARYAVIAMGLVAVLQQLGVQATSIITAGSLRMRGSFSARSRSRLSTATRSVFSGTLNSTSARRCRWVE